MIELYEAFCKYLERGKKTSANTIASYRRDVKSFIIFLHENGIYSPDKIDNAVISKYITALKRQKKSCATISRSLSSLRCFFKYLVMKNVIVFNPMAGIKNEHNTASLPQIMSSKEVDAFLSAPDMTTVKGVRDKAMFEALYATGARASELLELTVYDVNLDVGCIVFKGGEQKERVIPLYPEAVEAIATYMRSARDKLLSGRENTDVLFLNSYGSKMTRQGFWKIIRKYSEKIGLSHDITPKILRHSFAAHLLENGADINVIKDMLGHSALSSTMVYTKLLKNKYMDVYSHCHPRAKRV